jgi:phosphatidylserine/phosphatidylglycerophosphate/cardiolipin synthase-like enzyme
VQRRWVLLFGLAATIVLGVAVAAARILPLLDAGDRRDYVHTMLQEITAAEVSIELLLSTGRLDDVPLWDSLIAAAQRDVAVRVMLDASDWAPEITADNAPVLQALRDGGVEARFDSPAITTHAKLVIIDRRAVVIGSVNWNRYALQEHRQASVLIEDARVAAAFGEYFDRIWTDRLAPGAIESAPLETLPEAPAIIPLPDTENTACYAETALQCLRHARRSIHVVMYRMSYYPTFSDSFSNQLLEALVGAARRGLDVRVVLDDCAFYPDSLQENLEAALMLHFQGVAVRMDDPEVTTHAKLLVIDGETVLLGSTNWNYYALERNNEASVAILGAPTVAAPFEAFFESVWADATPVAAQR